PPLATTSPVDTAEPTIQLDQAQEIYKSMANNGVVVRFRGNELHCKDCLRVTVGTVEENNRFLELLEKTVAAVSIPK
ncbi:unnamed protein product, partial [Hapterophycus canaliculatus]